MLMRACLRLTMSSTITMSRSLERPTMMGLSLTMGNSPPWYFPLMNRKTYDRPHPGRIEGICDAFCAGACIAGGHKGQLHDGPVELSPEPSDLSLKYRCQSIEPTQ